MTDFILEPRIQAEITQIARRHGFVDIRFDTQFLEEGYKKYLANSRTAGDIIYRVLFLEPATRFYALDTTLFRKATEVLTLHEAVHHQRPFNSNPNADENLVDRATCAQYGNPLEAFFLDVLNCRSAYIHQANPTELRVAVEKQAARYTWISPMSRAQVVEELSDKRNYNGRRLRNVLRERGIIPTPTGVLAKVGLA